MVKFVKSIEAEVKDVIIPKFTGVKDGRDVIAIISDCHTWALSTHYIEGYGSFECFKGTCCLDFQKQSVSYVYPIAKYKMTGTGLDYTVPVEFMYIKASKDLYSQIKMFEETGGVLSETDFLFKCEDKQYQKFKIQEMKNKTGAKWKLDKDVVKQANEFLKTYELLIEKSVKLKPMDQEKYSGFYDSQEYLQAVNSMQQRLLNGGNAQGQGGQGNYTQNNNNNSYTQAPKQISASSAPKEVLEEDFDSLLEV